MRIVLDGRIVLPRMTGAGRYVIEVARRLPGLDPSIELHALLLPALRGTEVAVRLADAGVRPWYRDVRVASVRQWVEIPWMLRAIRPDLYHYPFLDLPCVPCPSVVTVYDLNPLLMADYFSRPRAPRRVAAWCLVHSSLRRCRLALTISETTRRLLERHFPDSRGKTVVTPLGVDSAFWSATPVSQAETARVEDVAGTRWRSRPYVLYVGVDRPHKNLVRLVHAFRHFRTIGGWGTAEGPYLWLAGVGTGSEPLRDVLREWQSASDVRLTGDLSEADLIRAYGGAWVVAYVSVSEGFGLPLLEAFAAGVPVLSSIAPSLREVAGDAALYVDPLDETAIARGLDLLWRNEDLRRSLIARGRQRALEFSWDNTARKTLDAYYKAVSGVAREGRSPASLLRAGENCTQSWSDPLQVDGRGRSD